MFSYIFSSPSLLFAIIRNYDQLVCMIAELYRIFKVTQSGSKSSNYATLDIGLSKAVYICSITNNNRQ